MAADPMMFVSTYESAGAVFDEPERRYRYSLHRMWGGGSMSEWRTVLWIMLNPSTADEHVLDPTLRRCERFTRAWGYDGFEVVNLFALRATDPNELLSHPNPVGYEHGDDNDRAIQSAVVRANLVICAWGSHRVLKTTARAATVKYILQQAGVAPSCLGKNQDGQPKHPLYLSGALQPTRFVIDCCAEQHLPREFLGEPWRAGPVGCTLPTDHEGDHVAGGTEWRGSAPISWPRAGAPVSGGTAASEESVTRGR